MSFRLEYRRYRLPLRRPWRTAENLWREREGLIVRLEDAAGRAGYGEAAPLPGRTGETLAEAQTVLDGLRGVVPGDPLAAVPERLDALRFALGSAADPEGGGAPAVERLPVAALLPAGREGLAAAERARAEGFTAFKWKVGAGDDADERAMLDDVLARLPAGARLRLDANGAWTSRQAAQWLERCAERPIEFVEQPCAAAPTAGPAEIRKANDVLLGLARDYPTPIALDESVTGVASLRDWLERRWPGVVVIKPALAGAPAAVLALLEAHRVDAVFSSALETGVGRRAALRMAVRYRGRPPRALGFGVLPLFGDSRFDGMMAAPFVAVADIGRIALEAVWNALS